MSRQPMLRRSDLQPVAPEPEIRFESYRQWLGGRDIKGVGGFMASVVDGPARLLWRSTEAEAKADALAYVHNNYRWSVEFGRWMPLWRAP